MSDTYLYVSAGSGPRECAWAAQRLAAVFVREANREGLSAALLTFEENARSFLLRISGRGAADFAQARLGTIRWIGQSPFRKNHKRKNWFVSVSEAPTIADIPEMRNALPASLVESLMLQLLAGSDEAGEEEEDPKPSKPSSRKTGS